MRSHEEVCMCSETCLTFAEIAHRFSVTLGHLQENGVYLAGFSWCWSSLGGCWRLLSVSDRLLVLSCRLWASLGGT